MKEIISKFASLVFDETYLDVQLDWIYLSLFEDDVLLNAELFSGIKRSETLRSEKLRSAIIADEVFSKVFNASDSISPMLFTPMGGSRLDYEQIIMGIFSAAFLKMYYLGINRTKELYIEGVLSGFNEFRKMIINKTTKIYHISGFTAVRFNMTNPPKKVVKYQEAAVNSLDSKFL